MAGQEDVRDEAVQAKGTGSAQPDGHEQATDLVGDLAKVDPKVLQAEIDRQVRKALKSREENIAKATAAERAEQERKAAEDRGEYERLKAQMAKEQQEMRKALILKDVEAHLRDVARDAGMIDLDDLRLMEGDALARSVSESGEVDVEAIRSLIKEFKSAKPHKFKSDAPTMPGSRFGGAPTPPPPPGAPIKKQNHNDPNYYRNDGLDDYVREREAKLKGMKTPARGGAMDALADALAKRLKL